MHILSPQTYEFTPADRSLLVMPLFHVHGLMAGFLSPLAAGALLHITRAPPPSALLGVLPFSGEPPPWSHAAHTRSSKELSNKHLGLAPVLQGPQSSSPQRAALRQAASGRTHCSMGPPSTLPCPPCTRQAECGFIGKSCIRAAAGRAGRASWELMQRGARAGSPVRCCCFRGGVSLSTPFPTSLPTAL